MELRLLRYFAAVVEEGGLMTAAELRFHTSSLRWPDRFATGVRGEASTRSVADPYPLFRQLINQSFRLKARLQFFDMIVDSWRADATSSVSRGDAAIPNPSPG
jgi:hypothetical protein